MTDVLDLVKSAAWLNRRLPRGIDGAELRAVLVETISTARPELAGRAEGASLDWLRATFDELEYPPDRPRENLSWLDELPFADAADVSPRILADREHLFPRGAYSSALDHAHPKETNMSDSKSPFVATMARIDASQRAGLPPLAFNKQAPGTAPSRTFDGNETEVIAQLRKIIDLAANGELDKALAKEGARLLDVLADLHEATPDPPAVRREREAAGLDARDSPYVAAVAKIAERQRGPLPPLRMSKGDLSGGGNAA